MDTPSKSLVGELKEESTTGSAPTHGTPPGENKDSSESNKEIAVLTRPLMDALQMLPLTWPNSNNEDSKDFDPKSS